MPTTVEVLNGDFGDSFSDYLPTAVVEVVEAIDHETGETHLIHVVPSDVPIWKAVGMLECVLTDLRGKWQNTPDEGDE